MLRDGAGELVDAIVQPGGSAAALVTEGLGTWGNPASRCVTVVFLEGSYLHHARYGLASGSMFDCYANEDNDGGTYFDSSCTQPIVSDSQVAQAAELTGDMRVIVRRGSELLTQLQLGGRLAPPERVFQRFADGSCTPLINDAGDGYWRLEPIPYGVVNALPNAPYSLEIEGPASP